MPNTVIAEAPYALAPGAGEKMGWFTSTVTLKASTPDLGVAEVVIHPGEEPPLHVHHKEDEWFYVLGGRILFHVGGKTYIGETGAFVLFPRDIPHTFTVESEEARFLVMLTPGGFEQMFKRNPKTIEDAVAAMNALDCEVVGPHPRLSTQ